MTSGVNMAEFLDLTSVLPGRAAHTQAPRLPHGQSTVWAGRCHAGRAGSPRLPGHEATPNEPVDECDVRRVTSQERPSGRAPLAVAGWLRAMRLAGLRSGGRQPAHAPRGARLWRPPGSERRPGRTPCRYLRRTSTSGSAPLLVLYCQVPLVNTGDGGAGQTLYLVVHVHVERHWWLVLHLAWKMLPAYGVRPTLTRQDSRIQIATCATSGLRAVCDTGPRGGGLSVRKLGTPRPVCAPLAESGSELGRHRSWRPRCARTQTRSHSPCGQPPLGSRWLGPDDDGIEVSRVAVMRPLNRAKTSGHADS